MPYCRQVADSQDRPVRSDDARKRRVAEVTGLPFAVELAVALDSVVHTRV